ncbi:MAG: ATP--guanido phosphotransferase [Clostridia bacterium]|nr:ATP--guanido phosphotransferase [Clostridia bacterium]
MKWYETKGRDSDVFVSSRIRLARNLKDYPFGERLDETSRREIVGKVRGVFEGDPGYTFTDFSSLPENERAAAAEENKVSPEFARSSKTRGVVESSDGVVSVMILEEDHVRIQSILPGLALEEAYDRADSADSALDSKLNIAYDDKLGYLTHCPTNLGTGMRASVMMFLPGTVAAGGIRSLANQLGKIGLTVRGMSGEGSAADGCLFQISNQVTLGVTEKETISKLADVTGKIAEQERTFRKKLLDADKDGVSDRVMRAYGTMLYAVMIDTKELLRLYSDVRLGVCLGVIDCVSVEKLDGILIRSMPAMLMKAHGGKMTAHERDRARAEGIRKILSGSDKE